MKCEEYQEWISQYLDHELHDTTSRELFLHLGTCLDCRKFLNSLLVLRDSIDREMIIAAPKSLDVRMKNIISKRRFQLVGDRKALSRIVGKRISVSVVTAIFVLAVVITTSAFVASRFFTEAHIVEKRVQETIYVVQLPQVEVKGYYPATTKSN